MAQEQKNWTYNQLTTQTEEIITRMLELAAARIRADDITGANIHRNHAYGAFSLWYSITCGWQQPGDSARLEALATQTLIDSLSGQPINHQPV